MSRRSVLITGGRGFVGAHVTRAFLDDGWEVAVFGPTMPVDLLADRRGAFADLEGSIDDRESVAAALEKGRPALVVSLAAFSQGSAGLSRSGEADLDRAIAINALGLRNLLEACEARGIRRVLWASSTVVFGPKALYGPGPVDEEAPRQPQTGYGLSKVLAEDIAHYYRNRHALETCGVRLPLVIGPGCWYAGVAGRLVELFEAVAAGRPARLEAPPGDTDFLYTEDAARLFLELARTPAALAPLYHASGFVAAFADFAGALKRHRPGAAVTVEPAPAGIDYPLVDAGRIGRDTGFRPRYDLDKAVAAYLGHLQGARP